ncbi:MAG: homoserine kinase [Desulfurococcales archaeon]|nr:homoserine kinase [Desulfurococcales archaeon]
MPRRGEYLAYCSSANLGSGFDAVAIALNAFYDRVLIEAEKGGRRVIVEAVEGPEAEGVSREENTAIYAGLSLLEGENLNYTVRIRLWKGIPLSAGLGGSGATAAAVVAGISDLLDLGLAPEKLVYYAGEGEKASAGSPHYDNVAASLLGGLAIVSRTRAGIKVLSLRVNAYFVLGIPQDRLVIPKKTESMRRLLPEFVPFSEYVAEKGLLSLLIGGLAVGNTELAGLGMDDIVVTRARSQHVPCLREAREESLKAGALGFAISGAGPSVIALARDRQHAATLVDAMKRAYENCGREAIVKTASVAPGVSRLHDRAS